MVYNESYNNDIIMCIEKDDNAIGNISNTIIFLAKYS